MPKDSDYTNTFERYVSYIMIIRAHKARFGSLIANLEQQQAFKEMKYPTTLAGAKDMLTQHKYDEGWDAKPKAAPKSQPKEETKKKPAVKEDDGTFDVPSLSFAQLEGKCWACGKKGHRSDNCPHKKKIPEGEWASSKANRMMETKRAMAMQQVPAQVHAQQSTTSDGAATVITTGTAAFQQPAQGFVPSADKKGVASWLHTQVATYEGSSFQQSHCELYDWILLDSQSTVDYFSNPKLLNDIRKSDVPLRISTNAGDKLAYHKGEVPN